MLESAYTHSVALAKLKQAQQENRPLRLAFLDVDGTWAGSPADQQAVRNLLESHHYVIVPVTNRGADLCLSTGLKPAQQAHLAGLLDADIIAAAFGTDLHVKQASGQYQADTDYHRRLPTSSPQWQADVQAFVNRHQPPGLTLTLRYLSLPEFRLEIPCPTPEAAQTLIDDMTSDSDRPSLSLARDDSNIILTPATANKRQVVDHIVMSLAGALAYAPSAFQMLLAGNSTADLDMGLHAGPNTPAVFVIPGGTTLPRELKMTKTEKDGMLPTGVYHVENLSRPIVVGDEAFPGTQGPQTLIAWLRQTHS